MNHAVGRVCTQRRDSRNGMCVCEVNGQENAKKASTDQGLSVWWCVCILFIYAAYICAIMCRVIGA